VYIHVYPIFLPCLSASLPTKKCALLAYGKQAKGYILVGSTAANHANFSSMFCW